MPVRSPHVLFREPRAPRHKHPRAPRQPVGDRRGSERESACNENSYLQLISISIIIAPRHASFARRAGRAQRKPRRPCRLRVGGCPRARVCALAGAAGEPAHIIASVRSIFSPRSVIALGRRALRRKQCQRGRSGFCDPWSAAYAIATGGGLRKSFGGRCFWV